MALLYQSKIRWFVFLGLAFICLQLTALLILSLWSEKPRSLGQSTVQSIAVSTTSTQLTSESGMKETNGEWRTLKETPLDGLMLKEQCRGNYLIETGVEGEYPYCVDEFKLLATRTGETKEHELLTLKEPAPGFGFSVFAVRQLGAATNTNARLLLQIGGLQDCDYEMTGCGYNYTIRLVDIGKPNAAVHFKNSGIYSADPAQWNSTFTKGYGFMGICEGGCIPEPVYGWTIQDAVLKPLTTEEAYINKDHYDGRISDWASDPYRHWGTVKWIDANRIEAELIDENGKMTRLRKEVK